ncbi:PhoH-like phosphate starvation-inducible [Vibrio phage Vp_R1]|uniref:PhoH-like protein n=1 Tax=Vibrio phage Vp_R1 TaxID=2059867 RepID=A0A2H5BPX1_9CAUD|nr:PhoH-like phosphate starvation-inducible [Vibrio phage Vp_R1]AUG88377.1 phosphate starvation-inducible protein [Vibrio phage Vp_R1]
MSTKDHTLKLTEKHKAYNLALYDHDRLPTIAYGSAGTGKTFSAVKAAVKLLNEGRFKHVVVTRPNVTFADKSGHLPGTEREKMEPWVRPVLQGLHELGYKQSEIDTMEKYGELQFFPLESIQGLTFHNSFIIVDEVQNMDFQQLKVFLTRQGKGSKVVLCGDIEQISPRFKNSGLKELIDMVEYFDMRVHRVHFTRDDIIRSQECKNWIVSFEDWELVKSGKIDFKAYKKDEMPIDGTDEEWKEYLDSL